MRYLLDTSVCVGAIRRKHGVEQRLRRFDPSELALSVISVLELNVGAGLSQKPELGRQQVESFVRGFDVLDVDPEVAARAAAVRVRMRLAGVAVGDFDLLIAATALTYDYPVITSDRDFLRIPDLRVEEWAA